MSQYDDLVTVSYNFSAINFAANSTQKLVIPRAAKLARVMDILVNNVSIAFTQVTSPGVVKIGDSVVVDAFSALTLGALAAGGSLGGSDQVGGTWKKNYISEDYGSGLHDLTCTFTAPTGGTPAGTADVTIVVGYDQINL